MLTDLQKTRQAFEEWATEIYSFTPALYEAAWDEDYKYYMHNDLSEYWPPFQYAWLARDEEVYRLLYALADMVNGHKWPSSKAQMDAYSAAVMLLAEYLPEDTNAD